MSNVGCIRKKLKSSTEGLRHGEKNPDHKQGLHQVFSGVCPIGQEATSLSLFMAKFARGREPSARRLQHPLFSSFRSYITAIERAGKGFFQPRPRSFDGFNER